MQQLFSSLLILFCFHSNPVIAQVSEQVDVAFRNAAYDVVIIRCDNGYAQKLKLIENRSQLSEAEFFDSLSTIGPFFCITASMIDSLCRPLGLYVKDGKEIQSLNPNSGTGNFFLKPNGVLLSDSSQVRILEAGKSKAGVLTGIQSGPMLLIDGQIHKGFNPSSKNRFIRCGAGIYEENGERYLVFAMSLQPVSFYDFASFFKEQFNCRIALHLESGEYCSMHMPTTETSYTENLITCRYLYLSL